MYFWITSAPNHFDKIKNKQRQQGFPLPLLRSFTFFSVRAPHPLSTPPPPPHPCNPTTPVTSALPMKEVPTHDRPSRSPFAILLCTHVRMYRAWWVSTMEIHAYHNFCACAETCCLQRWSLLLFSAARSNPEPLRFHPPSFNYQCLIVLPVSSPNALETQLPKGSI